MNLRSLINFSLDTFNTPEQCVELRKTLLQSNASLRSTCTHRSTPDEAGQTKTQHQQRQQPPPQARLQALERLQLQHRVLLVPGPVQVAPARGAAGVALAAGPADAAAAAAAGAAAKAAGTATAAAASEPPQA